MWCCARSVGVCVCVALYTRCRCMWCVVHCMCMYYEGDWFLGSIELGNKLGSLEILG